MYVFISYASENLDIAKQLCDAMNRENIEYFFAPRDIRPGHIYAEDIIEGINRSDVFLLLLSKAADESPHVLREVERAVSKKIPLVVYQLEEFQLSKNMEYFLLTHQWFLKEEDGMMEKLMRELKSRTSERPSGAEHQAVTALQTPPRRKKGKTVVSFLIAAVALLAILAVALFRALDKGESTEGIGEKGELAAGSDPADPMGERHQGDNPPENALHGEEPRGEDTGGGNTLEEDFFEKVHVGDLVTFGTYQGQSIEWLVLKEYSDGSRVLVARDILALKPFDVAEGGTYNSYDGQDYWKEGLDQQYELQVLVRGNSDWEKSNIRTWLNADTQKVVYEDMAPKSAATSEMCNGYDREDGFLYEFTPEEKEHILETEHAYEGNGLNPGKHLTRDKVYLLSLTELEWFEQAGLDVYAYLSDTAKQMDESGWPKSMTARGGEYFWWVRDASAHSACEGYLVGVDGIPRRPYAVGVEGFGIRPAITVR